MNNPVSERLAEETPRASKLRRAAKYVAELVHFHLIDAPKIDAAVKRRMQQEEFHQISHPQTMEMDMPVDTESPLVHELSDSSIEKVEKPVDFIDISQLPVNEPLNLPPKDYPTK